MVKPSQQLVTNVVVESEMLAKYASASLSFAFPFDRLTYFVKPVSCFMVTKHLEADYHITLNTMNNNHIFHDIQKLFRNEISPYRQLVQKCLVCSDLLFSHRETTAGNTSAFAGKRVNECGRFCLARTILKKKRPGPFSQRLLMR